MLTAWQMDPSGKSKGPPPAVKKVLSMFGSGREEDRMTGYLSFLKIGPKLLRFLPGAQPSCACCHISICPLPFTAMKQGTGKPGHWLTTQNLWRRCVTDLGCTIMSSLKMCGALQCCKPET